MPVVVIREKPRSTSKYRNIRTSVDGFTFDSLAEAKRYNELYVLMRAGKIEDLNVHPRYPLCVRDLLVCHYEADFSYRLCETDETIIEDVKSPATMKKESYRLKRKLFQAIYDVPITEVVYGRSRNGSYLRELRRTRHSASV